MIGRRNTLVTIQAPGATKGTSGEPLPWESPTEVAREWAEITPLRGREYFTAKEAQAEESTRVVIRYRDDLTTKMRLVWDSHTLRITSVQPDYTRKRETVLMCAE